MQKVKKIRFCSTFTEQHEYNFKIESTDTKSSTPALYEQKYPITQFYDDKGYLHNYKVKEMFETHLQKFINKV